MGQIQSVSAVQSNRGEDRQHKFMNECWRKLDKIDNEAKFDSISQIPPEFWRFLESYPTNTKPIIYMQCDLCDFVCRPQILIFSEHYYSHSPDAIAAITTPNMTNEELALTVCEKLSFPKRIKYKSFNRCELCGKNFKSKLGLKNHRLKKCFQFGCTSCGKIFRWREELKIHARDEHEVILTHDQILILNHNAKAVCFVCGLLVNEKNLEDHISSHSKQDFFVCDLCGKQFKHKTTLRSHIMKEMGMSNFVCEICGKGFVESSTLNKHFKRHIPESFDGTGIRKCDLCDQQFTCEISFNRHILEEVTCTICEESLFSRDLLKQHVLLSHSLEEYRQKTVQNSIELPVFACSLCYRRFTSEVKLQNHVDQDTKCELCFQVFDSQAELGKHVECEHNLLEYRKIVSVRWKAFQRTKNVETDREYTCHMCCKKLFSKRTLKAHIRMHSGIKPFKCETCGKAYASAGSFRVHKVKEANLQSFSCLHCSKKFNFKSDLEAHIQRNHKEKKYNCTRCSKKFALFKYLRQHSIIHSEETPFICELCHMEFKLKKYLKKHLRKHHLCRND